jgi:hypothetical protein
MQIVRNRLEARCLLAERNDGDGEEDEDDRANYNSDYDSDDIYGGSSYLGGEEGCGLDQL